MGTNAIVAAKNERSETLAAGYFNYDGYPEEVLPRLLEALEKTFWDGWDSMRILQNITVGRRTAEWVSPAKIDDWLLCFFYSLHFENGEPVIEMTDYEGCRPITKKIEGVKAIGLYAIKIIEKYSKELERVADIGAALKVLEIAVEVKNILERIEAKRVEKALQDMAVSV